MMNDKKTIDSLLLEAGPYSGLTPEMYQVLTKGLPTPYVDSTTTELQAGFILGVQCVLTKLQAFIRN